MKFFTKFFTSNHADQAPSISEQTLEHFKKSPLYEATRNMSKIEVFEYLLLYRTLNQGFQEGNETHGLAVDDDTVSTVEGVVLFTKDIFPSEYEAWIDSLLREQGVNDIQDLSFMKFFGNNK